MRPHLQPRSTAAGLAALAALTVLPALQAAAAPASPSSAWTRSTGESPRVIISGKPSDGATTVVTAVDRRGRSLSSGAQRDQVARGAFAPRALSSTPISDIQVTYDLGFQANQPAVDAFERAVTTWEHAVASPVTIKVSASLKALPDGQLGGAGPLAFWDPGDGYFYPGALADSLFGGDLASPDDDILAEFSDREDTFYFGADPAGISSAVCQPFPTAADPAPGPRAGSCYDFESVVLHELGHGLGFVGSVDEFVDPKNPDNPDNGKVYYGIDYDDATPFVYDAFTQTGNGTPILAYPNKSTALKNAVTSGAVYWNGPEAAGADRGREPRLYVPNPTFERGSSYSHISDESYPQGDPDALMTPFAEEGDVTRDPGEITLGMFRDMGWVTPGLPGSRYTALTTPLKVLDTGSALANAGSREVRIAGASGVPAGATAAVLNVTVVGPSSQSTVRVYPRPRAQGAPLPGVGNMVARAGETRDGLATVGIDRRTGRVRIHNSGGAARVVAYLVGFYAPDASSVDTAFHPSNPVRVMDTRNGTGVRRGAVGQGSVVELQVTGRDGIPAGATAVALTLTVVGPTANATVSTYPTGASPSVANVHLRRGETASNQVVVRIGSGGRIRFRNASGSSHLIADLAGWFHPTTTEGLLYRPSLPQRLLTIRLAAGGVRDATVSSFTGVPRTARAAVLSLTGGNATTATALQLYPTGTAVPRTQNLSLTTRQLAVDHVMTAVPPSGRVRVRNTAGTATVYVDLFGWFGPA